MLKPSATSGAWQSSIERHGVMTEISQQVECFFSTTTQSTSCSAGADVQGLWEAGRAAEIHAYCRQDVIRTYFLFLRVEQLRGRLTPERVQEIEAATRRFRDELLG